jgi:ABC-type multidrug transport system fused ATPase/permease subunit
MYANPIIQKANQRTPASQKGGTEEQQSRLDVPDALELPLDQKMHQSVEALEQIYTDLQYKNAARLEQEKLSSRSNTNDDVAAVDPYLELQSRLLTRALLIQQRRMLIVAGLLRLTNTWIQAFPAILVSRLLRLMEQSAAVGGVGGDVVVSRAMQTAVYLVLLLSLKMIVENLYFHTVVKYSTNVRGSLAGMIFDKSLRLPGGGASVTATAATTKPSKQPDTSVGTNTTTKSVSTSTNPNALGAGGVLNLMQSDTGIIESAAMQIHTTWDGPMQIAIYTTLLYRYLGPSVICGIGVLLLIIPVNSIALRLLNRLAKYENEAKDARTKRTAESIANMKLLKLQGWEQQFADDIRHHRREELQRHVTRGIVRAFYSAISNAVPAIVLVVTLTAYVKTGRPIVASTIFTAISLFNQLRFPLFFYPMLIDSLANGRNAMRRIATFLSADEIVPYVQHLPATSDNGGSIEMKNGNFFWPSPSLSQSQQKPTSNDNRAMSSAVPALKDTELKVNPGEVVAVVGSVASGKTALVKGLLGELNPVPGTILQRALNGSDVNDTHDATVDHPMVIMRGGVAYCSQEAWLPKGTIQEAITFGREYDEQRYNDAIRDAGLDEDIVSSLNGMDSKKAASSGLLSHDTDVGEGGSSLSGGQRARVALARALYSGDEAKVYLLDDCLAALDAHVGATVFERVTNRLRKSKAATILVTNDPNIPRRCDRVVLMGDVPGCSGSCSTIIDQGSYDELLSRGHDLRTISSVTDELPEERENETTIPPIDFSHASPLLGSGFSPQVIEVNGKNAIKIIGGSNGTCIDGFHADCDFEKQMEDCPDIFASQVEFRSQADSARNDMRKINVEAYFSSSNTTSEGSDVISTFYNTTESVERAPETDKISSADDSMSVGAVPRSTYISYFNSVRSPVLVLAMVVSYLLSNGAQFFQQYVVARWTEASGAAMGGTAGLKYLHSLVLGAAVVSVTLWIRSFLIMQVGVRASEFFHSRMLSSVFAAPMSFFDATPSGQLLSRFGKEIETVDRAVPDSIANVLFCFLQIAMSIGALTGIISPGLMLPLFLVGIMYSRMMSLFRPAARDLKRAETKTRSPIYTHFGETIRGCETIRSFNGASTLWSDKHRSLIDTNVGVFYTVKALDRWLSTRLETLGNTIVFATAVASVFLTRAGKLKPGSAGWGLTQSLAVTGLLSWAIRVLTDLESNMMSVMRVKELTDIDSAIVDLGDSNAKKTQKLTIPRELSKPGEALSVHLPESATLVKSAMTPPDSSVLVDNGWPWQGNVQFRNVSMRYSRNTRKALDGVSLSIPAGTTLGIVGRTGSGKSSLLLTLFRIVEIENGGSIEIDGVDIRSVGMETLRQSLSIIPQTPDLFTGSLAYNLDATGKATEQDMWTALEAASSELADFFRSADGLNTHVAEGGKNLSLGQRQLICLARALLRKSKILVLDEATSSVDALTDQQVQRTIRREFVDKGVTVITVAHRLDTVLGYDKIAVLGDGKLLEYGTPKELMLKPGGELRRLVLVDRQNKLKGSQKKDSSLLV